MTDVNRTEHSTGPVSSSPPPLIDVESVRREFLQWLDELRLPAMPGVGGWHDLLNVNPATDDERKMASGRRVRFSLTLHSHENQYLILLIENLAPAGRGVYALSVHVRRRQDEWQMQRLVESSYRGKFQEVPRASHTIWAQTVRAGEIGDGLNACARAILGHELRAPSTDSAKQPLRHPQPRPLEVPGRDDSQTSAVDTGGSQRSSDEDNH